MISAVTTTTASKATSSEVAVFPGTGNLQFTSFEVQHSAPALNPNQIAQPDVHAPTELVSAAPVPLPLVTQALRPDGKSYLGPKIDNLRHNPDQIASVTSGQSPASGSVLLSTSMLPADAKVSSESKQDRDKKTLDPDQITPPQFPDAFDPLVPHDGVPWTLHDAPAPAKTPEKPPDEPSDERKASSAAVANGEKRKKAISLPMVEVLTVAMDGQRVKPARLRQGRSARLEADKALGRDTVVPPRRSHWSDDCGLL